MAIAGLTSGGYEYPAGYTTNVPRAVVICTMTLSSMGERSPILDIVMTLCTNFKIRTPWGTFKSVTPKTSRNPKN